MGAGYNWLTHMPQVQVVAPFQPVKLWLLAAQAQGCSLHIKAWYEDGSSYEYVNSSHVLYKEILHEINCLPYHCDSVNLAPVKAGVKMNRYEVWMEGLTPKRTFVVDHGYYPGSSCLFAANSLGGVDCIWLHGAVKKGFDTETVEASRQFPREGNSRQRTRLIASRTGSRTWTINTGWKSGEEIEALADCLLSRQAWLLEDCGGYNQGTLCPVNIVNSSTPLSDSMSDLLSVNLDLVEAHNSQYL